MTMSSPTSSSEPAPSSSFARLHPTVQRWVHQQGWTTLHDAQEQAIGPILDADCDVIIAAATAAGKTEAAFLPILSTLAGDTTPAVQQDPWTAHDPWAEPSAPAATGVQVLYLSPLKALINDQFDRLEQMCELADVVVHRWHGDVSQHAKKKLRDNPSGVLLITPESLEATFVNRGTQVPGMFAGLRYIVVDELHSFLATPRGAQLQSLMGRIELAIRRRPPRIGLSATLGDMTQASAFLRPTAPERVRVIASTSSSRALQIQVRGYVATAPRTTESEARTKREAGIDTPDEDLISGDVLAISTHLFTHLRGTDNLVFANSRNSVEKYADLLASRSEAERLPNEFWPHHGSLSKEMRETVEAHLKDRTRPTTAVCTSTLEMGIDIGSVSSVAQVGTPPSVASLRQRLGRSGRRDEASVLRTYVSEPELDAQAHPVEELRCSIVQTTAMVRLMLDRWVESPDDPGFNYSTLIQQTMSTIAEHGGATAADLHRALCGPGPFHLVDQSRFVALLRSLAKHELIIQSSDGLLLHGPVGDRHVNHYDFYTAFQTEDEWRLTSNGRQLGTVPISHPLYIGVLLIFAGKRWKVVGIESQSRVVDLQRSSGGNPPVFGGNPLPVSNEVRAEMVKVYEASDTPAWLSQSAAQLLEEGRDAWRRWQLSDEFVIGRSTDSLVIPWVGDKTLFTMSLELKRHGVEASVEGPALEVLDTTPDALREVLDDVLAHQRTSASSLAGVMENRQIDKWDWALDDDLLNESAGARRLDVDGAWEVFEGVRSQLSNRAATDAQQVPAALTVPSSPPPIVAPAATVASRLPNLDVRDQEFCVVDVETTGFSTRLGDRVVEVAAVRMKSDGTVMREWSTLVNPRRAVGATHVHGITASDVSDAPDFAEIVGDFVECAAGAVLVAHNIRFDQDFLAAEFARSGHELPAFPALCTLSLGARVSSHAASRRLGDCCDQLGIEPDSAHTALGDARTTAKLLACYIAMAIEAGHKTLEDIGCTPLTWPTATQAVPSSGRSLRRGAGVERIERQGTYLAELVGRLGNPSDTDPNTAAYLDLLDRALEDRRLTSAESDALVETAEEWGIDAVTLRRVHLEYFDGVLATAASDRVITEAERGDLELVGSLLGIDTVHVADRISGVDLGNAGAAATSQNGFEGLSVCFTGALTGRMNGEPITRTVAEELAAKAGLTVLAGVTKKLDLLVVEDPDTQSGKAKKARSYGTRVIAEQVFWSTISAPVD